MRKPTIYILLRQSRRSRDVNRQRIKRKNRKWCPPNKRYVRPGAVIRAPRKFDVNKNDGPELVKFLRAVETQVLNIQAPVILDMKQTESFLVAGTILFFAELDRIITLSKQSKPVTILSPIRRHPREVLKQIGAFELTGDQSDVVPARTDVVFWRATKGNKQSGDKLQLLESVTERANAEHTNRIEMSGMWRGITEAVANTVDHAYEKPRSEFQVGHPDTKWWMFTQIRLGIFTAAVCDLGCGYRATINQSIPEEIVAKCRLMFTKSGPDTLAIQTAMEYGRSGTHQSHRGKGSRDALSVLSKHGDGLLAVLSNTGFVQYTYANGQEQKVESESIAIDIRGTVIWWCLSLGEPKS
jgi:hypothetical protein